MKKQSNKSKVIVTFLGLATLGAGAGAAAITSAPSVPANTVQVSQSTGGKGMGLGRRGPPGVIGTVAAVSGRSITVHEKGGAVYTVDLTNAKITKNVGGVQPMTITAADIRIGDTIGVRGTISGRTVTATFAMDGISLTAPLSGKGSPGGHHGQSISPRLVQSPVTLLL